MTGRRGRRRKQLLDDLREKRGERTRSHCVAKSLRKRLWNCRKTDCGENEQGVPFAPFFPAQ